MDIVLLINKINSYINVENLFDGYGFLKKGVDKEYDDIIDKVVNSKKWLTDYKNYLIESTGINNLKIGYTNNLGYYIEIPIKKVNNLPNDFILKQTLINTQRFTTLKLQEYERSILNFEYKIKEIENKYLNELFVDILNNIKELENISNEISFIDMICSFVESSIKYRLKRPVINNNDLINIKNGRNIIIQQKTNYIPNDLYMNKNDVWIITGPNMGGKSSFLRQNALIIILNQIGCFVPCDYCNICIFDKVFCRVGASDNIYKNQSTFMVEMIETSYIIKNATKNSFIIFDELGRGTSTYDGISIAWAVLEYIIKNIGAKVLFATHYFEISEIANIYNNVKNKSMKILETEDNIIFLYKIEDGVQNKSYGIDVAKLSGMPNEVIESAKNKYLKLTNSN